MLRIKCPICGKVQQEGNEGTSHVMCEKCAKGYRQKVEEEVKEMDELEKLWNGLAEAFGIEGDDEDDERE